MQSRIDYFTKFMDFFWLRPENAILLSIRAEKYAETLKYFDKDSIDVSCGDGIFSFITLGGEISNNYDMFQAIDISQKRKGDFDTYDFYDKNYQIEVIKQPKNNYKYGTDWKKNLLKKAEVLSFYDNLIEHDNNKMMPIEESSFGYVYSNSAYWVRQFENHINDLIRITKPGGTIVLELKTKNINNYNSINYATPYFGEKFGKIVDAGRLETWKGLKEYEEYIKLIEKNDLVEIKNISPIYGDMLAYIWDIGMRPLFNPLAKLANTVDSDTRSSVKKEWCEIFLEMFSEYVSNYEAKPNSAIEWIVVLEKK
ncbi:hypothetical protein HOB87_14825 [Candidatus Woesearchaeota archaeon]|mgnify:FL=1|nr:hypothetical protein [Candidatus Woesearchaeota archaeon]